MDNIGASFRVESCASVPAACSLLSDWDEFVAAGAASFTGSVEFFNGSVKFLTSFVGFAIDCVLFAGTITASTIADVDETVDVFVEFSDWAGDWFFTSSGTPRRVQEFIFSFTFTLS